MSLFQEGRYEASEALWRRLEAQAPENPFLQTSIVSCILSQANSFVQPGSPQGPSAEAIARLQEVLARIDKARAVEERDPVLLDQRGIALSLLRRWPEAIEAYQDSARLSPGTFASIPRQSIALTLFELGEDEAAARQAENLLRKDPECIDARALLAAIRWERGDEGGAETAWTEICEGVTPAAATNLLGQVVQDAGLSLGISKYIPRNGGYTFCKMYSSMDAVSLRWPPRAQAVYRRFLSRNGGSPGRAVG